LEEVGVPLSVVGITSHRIARGEDSADFILNAFQGFDPLTGFGFLQKNVDPIRIEQRHQVGFPKNSGESRSRFEDPIPVSFGPVFIGEVDHHDAKEARVTFGRVDSFFEASQKIRFIRQTLLGASTRGCGAPFEVGDSPLEMSDFISERLVLGAQPFHGIRHEIKNRLLVETIPLQRV
jgi:hypothetical protein